LEKELGKSTWARYQQNHKCILGGLLKGGGFLKNTALSQKGKELKGQTRNGKKQVGYGKSIKKEKGEIP